MDEETKRKAPEAETLGMNGRASKRQRLSDNEQSPSEAAKHVRDTGLRFVECLRQARDKSGRLVADAFLTLPNKEDVPEYYDRIALPMAIDTIEDKLLRGSYTSLSEVESDAKRMVNNAKHFNDRKSQIYEDAERVRKTTFNYMVKNNPAYRDKQYAAIATPLPDEAQTENHNAAKIPEEAPQRESEGASQNKSNDVTLPAHSASQDDGLSGDQPSNNGEDTSLDFTGKDLQEAQEMIISELIRYEESGLVIYTPFINLPARSLTDYYSVIKRPLSLKGAQKRVRGVRGRAPPTGISDYKSWEAFEQAVSLIWRNAQEYNEDGSEMYTLATDFERHFKDLIAKAKTKVSNPSQPTLKLKMSTAPKPSIRLRLGGQRDSPSSAIEASPMDNSAASGIIIDNKALERQQQHVKASINGHPPANTALARRSGSPKAKDDRNGPASRSASATSSLPVNGVKVEAGLVDPASADTRLPSVRPTSAPRQLRSPAPPVMAPPSRPGNRNISGSPHPHQPLQSIPNSANISHVTQYASALSDSTLRSAGKTAADSILPLVTVSTRPTLKADDRFCFCFPASNTETQTSKIITLSTHNSLIQVEPSLSPSLHSRPYRLFVTINGQRMTEIKYSNIDVQERIVSSFEAKLLHGVNRIEVEVVAAVAAKIVPRNITEQLEMEKMTIYAHVLRD